MEMRRPFNGSIIWIHKFMEIYENMEMYGKYMEIMEIYG
jgi:hypothetical protein